MQASTGHSSTEQATAGAKTDRSEGWGPDRKIAIWLLCVAALVFVMVAVGGITRLTESGLSIVTWKPVSGVVPPLSEAEWMAEFDEYRQYPEYQKVNRGMTLSEFKYIFWWEYGHRLLGRLIGVAFAVPLLIFWVKGYIRPELRPRLLGLLVLGGLQGLMGWYMVMSGLVDRPDVSHYRLTAHLSLALIIFAALVWVALGLLRPDRGEASFRDRNPALWRIFLCLVGLIILQILLGGFVAGLKAGLIYNTWPLMGGGLAPSDLWFLDPWWLNIFENRSTIQFNHRMVAYAVVAVAAVLWWKLRGTQVSGPANALLAVIGVQFVLGILTLIHVVPVALGATHQAVAVIVVAKLVWLGRAMVRA